MSATSVCVRERMGGEVNRVEGECCDETVGVSEGDGGGAAGSSVEMVDLNGEDEMEDNGLNLKVEVGDERNDGDLGLLENGPGLLDQSDELNVRFVTRGEVGS